SMTCKRVKIIEEGAGGRIISKLLIELPKATMVVKDIRSHWTPEETYKWLNYAHINVLSVEIGVSTAGDYCDQACIHPLKSIRYRRLIVRFSISGRYNDFHVLDALIRN
ncbi:hypothetical protein PFISCL1PPCAC_26817, partial [Pristionchus fissidentatus]